MAIKIQLRRGTAAEWTSANPTLSAGEAGFETDTGKIKFGDGTTAWTSLGYATSLPADVATDISDAVTAHNNETLNVHGIANTAVLETVSGAQGKADTALEEATYLLSVHNTDTSAHGVSGALVGTTDAQTLANKTMGDDLLMDGHQVSGLGTPTQADHAATKAYADSVAQGLHVKEGVDSATVGTLAAASGGIVVYSNGVLGVGATLTLTNPLTTMDGHTLTNGDRVLIKNEAEPAYNGIYVRTSSTVFTRDAAFDSDEEIEGGDFVFVVEGDVNGSTGWVMSSTVNTVGTDDMVWIQFSGAGTYLADGGLTLDGGIFSVDTTVIATRTFATDEAEAAATTYVTGHANLTADVHGIANTADLITTSQLSSQLADKADLDSPTFFGTVSLPETTSIGNVSGVDISQLEGVSSPIQGQIDDKLNVTVAATTYAPLDSATFTGTVALPETTSIGSVSSTELSYINGATSSIQDQLDAKASSTDLSSHASDTTGIHGIANTAALETSTGAQSKADAAESAANGYTDSQIAALTTADIEELTNLYFTDERAQDAVGANVGNGLVYDDVSAAISVDTGTGLQIDGLGAVEIDSTVATLSGAQTLTNKTIDTADNSITVVAADISDVTASAAELNILDGVTATATELNYVDGVTSAIQTQLDGKADLSGDTFTGNVIISSNTVATSTTSAALVITGGLGTGDSAYIGGNLVISGDFTVNGTTTTVSATDLSISDPLIYIGEGNNANSSDLGLVASFNDGTYQHAGFVRDSSDGKWKLFKGVIDEPTTTVNFGQGSLDALAVGAFEAASATIGNVSDTELQYLNGVTSAVQGQIDAKAPLANATFTGTVVLPSTTSIGDVSATELGYLDGVTSAIQTQLGDKLATSTAATTYAPLANATFTGTTTVSASGIAFTDGTQTKAGVPSITTISQKTASYTLSNLNERDTLIEVSNSSAVTLTIPADASVNYPVGTTLDILQTNTGQVTIAGAGGVTVNATPGLKLRTQWSSATLMKRAANTWIVFGDLMA